jgi:hypothetical protein
VDFINKENIVGFKVGENRRQVASTLYRGTGRCFNVDANLDSNNVG